MGKFFVCLAAMLMLSSCATYVTGSDGNQYEALTEKEIDRLIIISRKAMPENLKKRLVSKREYEDVMRTLPTVKIDYRGDKYGTATVIWRTRGRKVEFQYHDFLTDEIIPRCSFSTSYIPDEERRIQPDYSLPGR
ncbi:MAG: hypothetical protein E7051_08010 [Lentisphaerae bacterium]|nr:hypothetical protein [Lentisphaerota bacterium]MBR2720266.1 hypothetical protein [Lentisphaeria bacterium]